MVNEFYRTLETWRGVTVERINAIGKRQYIVSWSHGRSTWTDDINNATYYSAFMAEAIVDFLRA